jgi:hypothetical protein
MKPTLMKNILAVIAFWFLIGAVSSKSDTPVQEHPTEIVNVDGESYNLYITYDSEKALAGSQNLEIQVRIETPSRQNLKLIGCECDSATSVFSQLKDPATVSNVPPDSESLMLRTTFRLNLSIKNEVDPQEYKVDLRFQPPNVEQLRKKPQYRDPIVTFPVYVGDLDKGLLTVRETDKKPEMCTSGQTHKVTLNLHNGFHDYTVSVRKLMITSSPPELLDHVVSSEPPGKMDQNMWVLDAPLIIQHKQNVPLTLHLQMAGMSPGNYLSGFDEDSHVDFGFVYDDGNNRTLSNYTYPRPLRMQPSSLVLSIAVLLGISAGLFLMSVWKILKFEGKGPRKGWAIATTVLVALIVSILAFTGELNISFEAFKIRASYDKPMMLFVLSLFATVMGTPILRKLFGLDKASSEAPPTPTTLRPANN